MSVINDSIGAVLAQHEKEGKERTTYYLFKLFNDVEKKYTVIDKTYAEVVWIAQKFKHYFLTKKFKHYFLAHEVQLIVKMDPKV